MATKVKTGQMDPTTRLGSKIITATRDMTTASGNVSYTGVGFTPTAMIATHGVSTAPGFGISMVDSARTVNSLSNDNTAFSARIGTGLFLLTYIQGGSAYQYATVSSFDADGFTLAWTKSGSPTGTISLSFLCFR